MREYHKIQSIYKRDEKTHKFIEDNFSSPEFEYLQNNIWTFTEKIDGTNVRVYWNHETQEVSFSGRTANAQIPVFLYDKLNELFPSDKFKQFETSLCLYGEGYGARIQKGGGNYISNGVSFILFDVLVGDFWLRSAGVEDVASKLSIDIVPVIGEGTLHDAIRIVKNGLYSTLGKEDFIAEGLVLRPKVDLFTRMGHRIITKVKGKDFV